MGKRVAFFNQYSLWGGGEKWHFEMALFLRDKGHEVFVFTPLNGELGKRSIAKNLRVIDINVSKLSYINPCFLFSIYLKLKKLNLNSIIFNSFLDVRAAAFISRLAGVKNVMLRCGMPIAPKQNWAYKLAFQKGLTRFVPITYAIRDEFYSKSPQLMKGVLSDKIVYNAIDMQKFTPGNPKNEVFTIGNAVRLSDQKGIDILFGSLKRLKERGVKFRFHLAGNGELEESLKQLAEKLGLTDEVSFLGFTEDVPKFLRSIDLLAFSSKYEGAARTILEGMASKLPIVAFDVSSMGEMIESGKTGLLAKPFDEDDFADCLEKMITDKEFREYIKNNAFNYVYKNFDQKIVYEKWPEIIFENS